MFSLNPMKELYESPLPPMALTDYEAFSKFLNQALHCCHETGRDFNVYLDWPSVLWLQHGRGQRRQDLPAKNQNSSVFLGRFDPTV